VYRALDKKLQRRVALKVLRKPDKEDAGTWDRAVAGMLREARAAAALSHPNAIALYDVGEADGVPYLAMELVEGTPLRHLIGAGTTVSARLRWLLDVARALAAAHRAGLVHRDIKPENIMLRSDGVIKVLDFGIARRLRLDVDTAGPTIDAGAAATLSGRGRLVGTPAYMAPEQLRGEPIDGRADQFSWGVLAYEVLADRLPFGEGRDMIGVLADLMSLDAPPLDTEGVPEEVEAIVLRALSKSPEERFSSMDDVIDALSAEVAGEADAGPPSRGRAAPPSSRAAEAASGNGVSVATLPRRRPRWPLFAAAGAAVAIAAVLFAARGTHPAPAAAPAAPAPAAPAPTPITETAPPKTSSPEALAAYREGLQGFRDAAWGLSHESFERAVKLDPMFAAAHLRLAMTSWYRVDLLDVRKTFQKAVQLRPALSERDQALLDTMEPMLQREPPDILEARRRASVASDRYPADAEFLQLVLLFSKDESAEKQLDLAERCLALDPRYADCWQAKAEALERLDRIPEALRAFDQCLEVSPSAIDCLRVRAGIHSRLGQCERYDEDARAFLAKAPAGSDGYYYQAAALYALDRPAQAVRGALQQSWLRQPESMRERAMLADESRLAAVAGRFEDAERHALELDRKVALDPAEEVHLVPTLLLVDIYQETGRAKEAGKIADAMLSGRDAWAKSPQLSIYLDRTVMLLHSKLDAGMISRPVYEAEREAWVRGFRERWRDIGQGAEWVAAYALPASTTEEAKEALAAQPDLSAIAYSLRTPEWGAVIGKVHLLAGRPRDALPHLSGAAGSCGALMDPFSHTTATYRLAEARAALGDKAGACSALGVVLARWGGAKESVTAKAAAARSKELRCSL
jgi:serine/threonine-protein kinase